MRRARGRAQVISSRCWRRPTLGVSVVRRRRLRTVPPPGGRPESPTGGRRAHGAGPAAASMTASRSSRAGCSRRRDRFATSGLAALAPPASSSSGAQPAHLCLGRGQRRLRPGPGRVLGGLLTGLLGRGRTRAHPACDALWSRPSLSICARPWPAPRGQLVLPPPRAPPGPLGGRARPDCAAGPAASASSRTSVVERGLPPRRRHQPGTRRRRPSSAGTVPAEPRPARPPGPPGRNASSRARPRIAAPPQAGTAVGREPPTLRREGRPAPGQHVGERACARDRGRPGRQLAQ